MINEQPLVLVIFGATGDLMYRKLMPAIYSLVAKGRISQHVFIVAVGRREITPDQFRELMARSVQESGRVFNQEIWRELARGMYYEQGFFEDPALYQKIIDRLAGFDEAMKACVPRFFYLATPPQNYEPILEHLNSSKLAEGCGHGTVAYTRVLIEKPFGRDLATAKSLDELLASIFEERQIYRIDHYLGKETVQNILAFRFANGIFEPTWNRDFLDHVQITIAEEDGVGKRGPFYDGVGALRDVVQSHLMELLALIAMERPQEMSALSIREKRKEVLKAIRCIRSADVARDVVRGQYEGYRKEKGIAEDSQTETFVALKLFLDLPRWKDVPFYLRTGKKLKRSVTEISLHFKKPLRSGEASLFSEKETMRNILSIQIQPTEGITLRLMVKKPGLGLSITPTTMKFHYTDTFSAKEVDAHERLFLDAIAGDQTLFASTDEIASSWELVMGILDGWASKARGALLTYAPGSMGPKAADALIEKDGRHWFLQEDGVQ